MGAVVPEAGNERTESGLVPQGDGWFVLNAREARWWHTDELGSYCPFEGDARFPELGINITMLRPGEPSCMYHGESAQEDFLILSGEALLIVEGQERPLRAWDFVHCPSGTEHVLVGAGDAPCVFLAVGARPDSNSVLYPVNEAARRHDAGVVEETTSPAAAYARFSPPVERPYRDGDLA